MAKLVFLDGYISVNGVDLSDHASDITLDLTKADIQTTTMGQKGVSRLAGLEDDKITVTFFQDFAAAEIDATLQPLWSAGSLFPGTVMAVKTGGASSTNPTYSGTFIILDYQPVAGKVGDALATTVTMSTSGTITRGTTGP